MSAAEVFNTGEKPSEQAALKNALDKLKSATKNSLQHLPYQSLLTIIQPGVQKENRLHVLCVQILLAKLGFNPSSNIDGKWGQKTQTALQNFLNRSDTQESFQRKFEQILRESFNLPLGSVAKTAQVPLQQADMMDYTSFLKSGRKLSGGFGTESRGSLKKARVTITGTEIHPADAKLGGGFKGQSLESFGKGKKSLGKIEIP